MIGIVDYDIGNLRSVQKALQHVGGSAEFVRTPAELERVAGLVLPGVGNFGDCVRSLRRSGMWDAVQDWAQSDRPFFGVCVGYQMLFESSEEAPSDRGLALFPGRVRRFTTRAGLKIPQIGWNTLTVRQPGAAALAGLSSGDYVYFVHSFFPVPEDPALIALDSTYGETFAAAILRGSLIATQFHPEKSQRAGLRLFQNFVELVARSSAPVAAVPPEPVSPTAMDPKVIPSEVFPPHLVAR